MHRRARVVCPKSEDAVARDGTGELPIEAWSIGDTLETQPRHLSPNDSVSFHSSKREESWRLAGHQGKSVKSCKI